MGARPLVARSPASKHGRDQETLKQFDVADLTQHSQLVVLPRRIAEGVAESEDKGSETSTTKRLRLAEARTVGDVHLLNYQRAAD